MGDDHFLKSDVDIYFENRHPIDEKFKNRSPLVVTIKIYDRVDNALVRDHTRDLRKGKNKDWFIGALLWALQNGKYVKVERK